jgi:4-hydroxy-tetrahydrodipicolinate synthase
VALAREGTIAGLKDSSGDDGNLRYVLADMQGHPDFFAMTGSEIVVDSVLAMGAHGVVPGLGNVDPAGYVKLWDLCRKGDFEGARAEQERLCRLFEIIRISLGRTSAGSAGVGAFKAAMRSLGVIADHTMARPQRTLNAEERTKVDAILRDTGLLGT